MKGQQCLVTTGELGKMLGWQARRVRRMLKRLNLGSRNGPRGWHLVPLEEVAGVFPGSKEEVLDRLLGLYQQLPRARATTRGQK